MHEKQSHVSVLLSYTYTQYKFCAESYGPTSYNPSSREEPH